MDPAFGPLEALRLSIQTDSPVWVILSEVSQAGQGARPGLSTEASRTSLTLSPALLDLPEKGRLSRGLLRVHSGQP